MNITEALDVTVDKTNKRLKVYRFKEKNHAKLASLAKKEGLEKIILFQKEGERKALIHNGFLEEGKIDGFFAGETAYILTKYLNNGRKETDTLSKEDTILETINNHEPSPTKQLEKDYKIRSATEYDAPEIVDVFGQVFKSYPTPMDDEEYVKQALNTNVDMAVVEKNGQIVGLSSAEIDYEHKNAEITDCATLPSNRGKGLNNHLIRFLEKHMKQKGIVNLFSIARAKSFGMNKVLYNLNYKYRGRLINNVHIAGDWENMNIWVKQI